MGHLAATAAFGEEKGVATFAKRARDPSLRLSEEAAGLTDGTLASHSCRHGSALGFFTIRAPSLVGSALAARFIGAWSMTTTEW